MPPDWYTEMPELRGVESFYIEAFWDLSTMRPQSGGVIGPIPWRAIVDFGCWVGMSPAMIDGVFKPVIQAIDVAFLGHMREQYERESRRQKNSMRSAKAQAPRMHRRGGR